MDIPYSFRFGRDEKIMMRKMQTAILATLLTIAGISCLAQDKVMLTYKAKKGQVIRYKTDGSLTMEAGGNKVDLDIKQVEKDTITDVSASGDITTESITESEETTVNGEKAPSEEDKTVSTVISHADGSLVSYKLSTGDADGAKSQARIRNSLTPIFTSKPVGVGDKWTIETKENAEIGLEDAKAEYEVLGVEKLNGVDCLKVKMVYHETKAKSPLSSTSTLWIEKSSGDTFAGDTTVENLQFGGKTGPLARGKLHESRIEGSPLGDVKPGTAAPEAKVEPKKEKSIDEVVKDYEKLPGLYTLYRKKDSGRETIYMEIKEAQLNQLILIQATVSTGNGKSVSAGDPLVDIPVKFVRMPDEKIYMITPNTDFRANEATPISRSIKRSFPDGYVDTFRVEGTQKDRKSLLINISDLFKGDTFMIGQAIAMGTSPMGGGAPYGMDREKTYIASIKNFPENMVFETAYHFMGGSRGGIETLADPRSMPIRVVYNVSPLPETSYKPRIADSRIGYFLTEFQSFDDDNKRDPNVRYINRWNLHKANPAAAMSPPNKQIVFWIDNAVPVEYRDALKQGILFWNKAFEKIGIKDAIAVNQMPDKPDWDPADLRYNVVHWISSPSLAYAVAHPRINPITGEILNAGINIDGNFTRAIKIERDDEVDPVACWLDPKPDLRSAIDPRRCEFGNGMMEQAWFGHMALDMLTPGGADDKTFVTSYLREVVAHEMGHILGLRHNFIASTYHSDAELTDGKLVAQTGTTASLMDYTPFNIFALKHKGVDFFSTTVGPYDMWAIEYGYTDTSGLTPAEEKSKLQGIASQCNLPGHAYETDELADSWDPNVVKFDLAKDPMTYWSKRLEVSRYMLLHLGERLPKNGESYHEFTRAYLEMLGIYSSSAAYASHYIGGLYVNRNHKGDAGQQPTLKPIDGLEQRRALQLLDTYIFSANAFNIPRSYYTMLADDPFAPMTLQSFLSGPSTYPVLDQISSIQKAALSRVFNPAVLARVVNNEYKIGPGGNALTLESLFNTTRNTIWSDLDSKTVSTISPLHRQLQRAHIDALIGMFLSPSGGLPDDAKMLAWNDLRTIQSKIKSAKLVSQDTYTKLHLEEAAMMIGRALEAKQTVSGAGTTSRGSSLMDLLGQPVGKQ
jgi:hypothetical protein